jgi:hypothetical protein
LPQASEDTRTPEQKRAWVEYEQRMEGFDLGTVLAEQPHP